MNIAVPPGLLGAEAKAFLTRKQQMLIGGKWVDALSGKTFDVFDPANGREITSVPEADKADVDRAVAAARAAFDAIKGEVWIAEDDCARLGVVEGASVVLAPL